MRNFQNHNSEPHIYVFFLSFDNIFSQFGAKQAGSKMFTFLFLNVADGRTSPLRGSAGLNHF